MITINPNKQKTLTFKVDITGSKEVPVARLVFLSTQELSVMFNAMIKDNLIIVDLKPLKPYLGLGLTGDAKLELIIDGYYFTPWNGKIEFKEEPEVANVTLEETEVEKPSISVVEEDDIILEKKKPNDNKELESVIMEDESPLPVKKRLSKLGKKLTGQSPIRKALL
jgi:hypothetical protein